MTMLVIIAIVTLASALAAATLRNLMHAALNLVLAFLGVAAFYFFLNAEFVGLVQVLVYVGAVAVLIVFTILLTRRDEEKKNGVALGRLSCLFDCVRWIDLGDCQNPYNRHSDPAFGYSERTPYRPNPHD